MIAPYDVKNSDICKLQQKNTNRKGWYFAE